MGLVYSTKTKNALIDKPITVKNHTPLMLFVLSRSVDMTVANDLFIQKRQAPSNMKTATWSSLKSVSYILFRFKQSVYKLLGEYEAQDVITAGR